MCLLLLPQEQQEAVRLQHQEVLDEGVELGGVLDCWNLCIAGRSGERFADVAGSATRLKRGGSAILPSMAIKVAFQHTKLGRTASLGTAANSGWLGDSEFVYVMTSSRNLFVEFLFAV